MSSYLMRSAIAAITLSFGGMVSPVLTYGQEKPVKKTSPPENPPHILVASSIDAEDNLLLVNYKTIFIGLAGESYNSRSLTKVPLKDVRIGTAKGGELSVKSARKRISGRDMPILVSSWKAPLPEFYKSMFTAETLHFVFPKQAPIWRQIQEPGRPVR